VPGFLRTSGSSAAPTTDFCLRTLTMGSMRFEDVVSFLVEAVSARHKNPVRSQRPEPIEIGGDGYRTEAPRPRDEVGRL
jgi:hypothetical protein